MSEKRVARECFAAVTKDGDSYDLYTFDDEESANAFAYTYSGRHFKMREVIEPDTSCESKMDAAVQMLTEKNAEIEKLRKALNAAMSALTSIPHQKYCEYWNKCTCAKRELQRINSIFGLKEGADENG